MAEFSSEPLARTRPISKILTMVSWRDYLESGSGLVGQGTQQYPLKTGSQLANNTLTPPYAMTPHCQ